MFLSVVFIFYRGIPRWVNVRFWAFFCRDRRPRRSVYRGKVYASFEEEPVTIYGRGRRPRRPASRGYVYASSKEETISNGEVFSSLTLLTSLPYHKKDSVSLSRTRGKCSVGAYLCVRPFTEVRFTLHLVHFTAGASPRPAIIDIASREGQMFCRGDPVWSSHTLRLCLCFV